MTNPVAEDKSSTYIVVFENHSFPQSSKKKNYDSLEKNLISYLGQKKFVMSLEDLGTPDKKEVYSCTKKTPGANMKRCLLAKIGKSLKFSKNKNYNELKHIKYF